MDANIQILNSQILDSSFGLGMLYIPSRNFNNPNNKLTDTVFRYHDNQGDDYIPIIEQLDKLNKEYSLIYLENSVFGNLNYG